LQSANDYRQWYNQPPPSPQLIEQAIYGLPELGNKHAIAQASLIANPGCYPTAAVLAAFPVLKSGMIDDQYILFDAKSGISGAGRGLSLKSHFCEVMENIVPYQIAGTHRHTPEIEQALSNIAGRKIVVQFTPHLIPIIRGILITAYFKLKSNTTQDDILALYQATYQQEPFIRLSRNIASVKNVRGTNYCDLSVQVDPRTNCLIVTSVIDNLIKGAVGQAIQNMNIMHALPETTGLHHAPATYP
jgi:N-acetyl-gamma-glutamyl-phosphate reductase